MNVRFNSAGRQASNSSTVQGGVKRRVVTKTIM